MLALASCKSFLLILASQAARLLSVRLRVRSVSLRITDGMLKNLSDFNVSWLSCRVERFRQFITAQCTIVVELILANFKKLMRFRRLFIYLMQYNNFSFRCTLCGGVAGEGGASKEYFLTDSRQSREQTGELIRIQTRYNLDHVHGFWPLSTTTLRSDTTTFRQPHQR